MPGNPYPHKYRFGKQKKPIGFDEFENMMETGEFKKGDYHRSFLAFLFWFGLRRRAALERERGDFEIEDGVLFVTVAPLKRGIERPPLEIDIDLPYVDLIVNQVMETPEGERVWQFSEVTAWRIVKRVDERIYPHFFRLNRATHFLDDPTTTIPEMKSWFGWKDAKTISSYIGMSRRYVQRGRERLRREVQ